MFDRDSSGLDLQRTNFDEHSVFTGDRVLGQHRGTDFFFHYWQDLCKQTGGKPMRSDIDPRQFTVYLPHVVINEVESLRPFDLRTRLCGTFVARHYGELTGKTLADMDNQKAANRIRAMSQQAIIEQRPVLSATPGFDTNKQNLIAYALYLPLFDENGRAHQILTAVFVERLSESQRLFAELTRLKAMALR